jgi:hypothetical protein
VRADVLIINEGGAARCLEATGVSKRAPPRLFVADVPLPSEQLLVFSAVIIRNCECFERLFCQLTSIDYAAISSFCIGRLLPPQIQIQKGSKTISKQHCQLVWQATNRLLLFICHC